MDQHQFFRTVEASLDCDAARAEAVSFAVFQELRDRLTSKEASDVAAQLPVALARLWREGEAPGRQVKKIHAAEFIGRVRRRAVLVDDAEAERAIRAVFGALRSALGSTSGLTGEAWDVFSQLPKDMKLLWLEQPEPATR